MALFSLEGLATDVFDNLFMQREFRRFTAGQRGRHGILLPRTPFLRLCQLLLDFLTQVLTLLYLDGGCVGLAVGGYDCLSVTGMRHEEKLGNMVLVSGQGANAYYTTTINSFLKLEKPAQSHALIQGRNSSLLPNPVLSSCRLEGHQAW